MATNKNAVVSTPQHLSQNSSPIRIIAKSPHRGQLQGYKRLVHLLREDRLTESLELLSEHGIEGNTSIFVISLTRSLVGGIEA
uniref:Uncharacterized protein n=1 Tax=Tolypothrix bouteillei VB521301 TaxID=1479485 RepID=A0A0C1NL13_9CYAN